MNKGDVEHISSGVEYKQQCCSSGRPPPMSSGKFQRQPWQDKGGTPPLLLPSSFFSLSLASSPLSLSLTTSFSFLFWFSDILLSSPSYFFLFSLSDEQLIFSLHYVSVFSSLHSFSLHYSFSNDERQRPFSLLMPSSSSSSFCLIFSLCSPPLPLFFFYFFCFLSLFVCLRVKEGMKIDLD
ncbi:hypothetical protein S83_021031 [Arachis hypogaea]